MIFATRTCCSVDSPPSRSRFLAAPKRPQGAVADIVLLLRSHCQPPCSLNQMLTAKVINTKMME